MRTKMNNQKIDQLIITPIPHNGHGQVYQTNLWDILRQVHDCPSDIDLLIGPKKEQNEQTL
jgi:hypothetical protein